MLVTPLQMAMVAGAIGVGGRLMEPQVVDRIVAPGGRSSCGSDRRSSARGEPGTRPSGGAHDAARRRARTGRRHRSSAGRSAARRAPARRASRARTRRGSSPSRAATRRLPPELAIAVVLENQEGTGGETAAPIAGGHGGNPSGARRIPNLCAATMTTQDTLSGTSSRGAIASRGSSEAGDGRRLPRRGPGARRRVAIKILHARYANDEQFVERFRREATHAAGLSHPNIVSIYDRGETNGSYFIVMEYVEGGRSRS